MKNNVIIEAEMQVSTNKKVISPKSDNISHKKIFILKYHQLPKKSSFMKHLYEMF